MATVQYSACVTLSENTQFDIYTMEYEGRWEWFGSEKEVTGRDDLGCRVFRLVRNVDCGDARYDSSAAAIVAAVARYGDVPGDWGLSAVEDIIIDGDDHNTYQGTPASCMYCMRSLSEEEHGLHASVCEACVAQDERARLAEERAERQIAEAERREYEAESRRDDDGTYY